MAARTNPHGEHRFVLEYLSGWFFLMIFELLERCVSWPLTQIQVGNCENYLTLFCFFFLITCNPASIWWCFMLVGNVKMFVHGHGFGNGLNVEIWQMLYTWIPMDRYSCLTHTDVLASYLCLCSMAFLCLPLLQANQCCHPININTLLQMWNEHPRPNHRNFLHQSLNGFSEDRHCCDWVLQFRNFRKGAISDSARLSRHSDVLFLCSMANQEPRNQNLSIGKCPIWRCTLCLSCHSLIRRFLKRSRWPKDGWCHCLTPNDPKFWDMSHNAAAIISTITALVS